MKPDFNKGNGLLPAIIQDPDSKKVLMLGYFSPQSYEATLKTKEVYFFSRSKNRLWKKGETSGDILKVQDILLDCDGDTFLVFAKQTGKATCHTGRESCFFYQKDGQGKFIEFE